MVIVIINMNIEDIMLIFIYCSRLKKGHKIKSNATHIFYQQ